MENLSLKIEAKGKIVLGVLLSLLIIFLLIYFFIAPAVAGIKNIRDELEIKRVGLEKDYQKGKNLRKLSENLKKVKPQIEELNKVFISSDQALEFVTSLEKIADKENIEQKINLSPNKENVNDVCEKISLQLLASGNFNAALKYLSELEKLDYYINIRTLEISPARAETDEEDGSRQENLVDLQILAKTYWQ
jgi:Tfp pilus assembly protein PilO